MIRRTFLKDAAIAASYGVLRQAAPVVAASTTSGSLKSLVSKCGIHVGVQTEIHPLQQVPQWVEVVKDNFDLLTPGNELKWPRLRPTPDSFNFADADWMVNFCETNGLLINGTTLCWNAPGAYPSWFQTVLNNSNANQILVEHITTVMRKYAGRIDSWIVVNEPVTPWSKRSDGLYPGVWLNFLGPEYIEIAFHAAAAADPKALRVLNTYQVEHAIPKEDLNRANTLHLVKQLLDRKVPVQAVGIESHLNASYPPGGESLTTFVKQIRDMGLQILITELDVDDTQINGTFQARDEAVAKTYQVYLEQVVSTSDMKRIIFWSPSDKWDWLDSVKDPTKKRPDGAPHRAGFLDQSMAPKAAYGSVQAAFREICVQGSRR